ncbi:MAG TPA: hypothetical protein VNA89_07910 [Gemmatimonadaceae bacterium]|nr:hypothetical protein [Gemmatimonadaceae bacterium]
MADGKRTQPLFDVEEQDDRTLRREWRVQRVGWVVMALLVAAALAGAFGRGPLAEAKVRSPSGLLEVDYQRLTRHESSAAIDVAIDAARLPTREARLWVDREYLSGVSLDRVVPEPERSETGRDRVTMVFPIASGERTARVQLQMKVGDPWLRRIRMGVEGGDSVEVTQFVYP